MVTQAKASTSKFEKDLKALFTKHGGQKFLCSSKIDKPFNSDSTPTKAMWRFISKIFENNYGDAEFKKVNGIGSKAFPSSGLDFELGLVGLHFD